MGEQGVEGGVGRIQLFRPPVTAFTFGNQCKNSNQQNEKLHEKNIRFKLFKNWAKSARHLIWDFRLLVSCVAWLPRTKRVHLPDRGNDLPKKYSKKELEDGLLNCFGPFTLPADMGIGYRARGEITLPSLGVQTPIRMVADGSLGKFHESITHQSVLITKMGHARELWDGTFNQRNQTLVLICSFGESIP